MDYYEYFYNMMLRGYEVVNVSYKKIMKDVELRANKDKLKDFIKDHFDKKMIADYFKMGIKAKIFKDSRTGKLLTENDQLFFGFEDSKFQYTIRRQALVVRDNNANIVREMIKRQLVKKE